MTPMSLAVSFAAVVLGLATPPPPAPKPCSVRQDQRALFARERADNLVLRALRCS